MAVGTDYNGDKAGLLGEGIENKVFRNGLQAVDGDDNQEALKNLAETFWAPEDGKLYARQDGVWTEVEGFPEAPVDGKEYARKDEGWVEVSGFLEWKYTSADSTLTVETKKGYTYTGTMDTSWSLPDPATSENGQYTGVKNSSDYSLAINKSNGDFFQMLNPGDSFIFSFEDGSSEWQIVSDYRAPEAVDANQAIFYVDNNVGVSGDGSTLAPFKLLEEARDAVIGLGSNVSPDFNDAKVEVLNGNFSISSGNFYIKDCLYNFSEGVTVNYSATSGSYMFDASVYDAQANGGCDFSISGNLSWESNNSSNGFFCFEQKSYTSATGNNIDSSIEVDSIIRTVTAGSYPLVYLKGYNRLMGYQGRGLNILRLTVNGLFRAKNEGSTISSAKASCLYIGPGVICSSYNANFGAISYDAVDSSNYNRIHIDGAFRAYFTDCIINGGEVRGYVKAEKECYDIRFIRCEIGVGENISEGFIELLDGADDDLENGMYKHYYYGSRDYAWGGAADSGLLFQDCNTSGENTSSLIIKNSTGVDTLVDFKNNVFTADYDPTNIGVGYYRTSTNQQPSPYYDFRSNIFLGRLRYSNLPNSASGLSVGDVWAQTIRDAGNNILSEGVLTVVV